MWKLFFSIFLFFSLQISVLADESKRSEDEFGETRFQQIEELSWVFDESLDIVVYSGNIQITLIEEPTDGKARQLEGFSLARMEDKHSENSVTKSGEPTVSLSGSWQKDDERRKIENIKIFNGNFELRINPKNINRIKVTNLKGQISVRTLKGQHEHVDARSLALDLENSEGVIIVAPEDLGDGYAPRFRMIRAETEKGAIRIERISAGKIVATSKEGTIDVRESNGPIEAMTQSGIVKIVDHRKSDNDLDNDIVPVVDVIVGQTGSVTLDNPLLDQMEKLADQERVRVLDGPWINKKSCQSSLIAAPPSAKRRTHGIW